MRTLFVPFFLLLIFATAAPAVYAVSVVDEPQVFNKCWEYQVVPNLGVSSSADAASVYFFDNENKLQGVDLLLGSKIWSSELGGEVVSNLLLIGDSIFVVTNSQTDGADALGKAVLRSVSRHTGITEWRADISTAPIVWLGSVSGNVIAVGSEGSISAFNRGQGKPVWKTDLASGVSSAPHFEAGGVELGTRKNEVIKISLTDGLFQVIWKSKYLPTAVLRDEEGRLLVGDERGNLISVSQDGSRLWRFKNGAQISSVSLHNAEYLAASHDNFVYKLSRSGNVIWKRRLSGRVIDRPLILGDTAIVSILGAGVVYALDLRNGKISNRIETGDEVSLRVAVAANGQGFIIEGPRGLSFFSRNKCPAK